MSEFTSSVGPGAKSRHSWEYVFKILKTLGTFALLMIPVLWASATASRASSRVESEAVSSALIQGITISCQGNGRQWASSGFGPELDRLAELGVNWVAIHPYAGISADGTVRWSSETSYREQVLNPLREAKARGMHLFVKPHLAYWGSPFGWRGEIDFAEPEQRARFFETYSEWMLSIAEWCDGADAIAVGTELDRLIEPADEAQWRALIAGIRERSSARLTYAANWTDYQRVGFWDALDAIGVQAYFPIAEEQSPTEEQLDLGWEKVLEPLRNLSQTTGKPVVFTELGYDASPWSLREPWLGRHRRSAPTQADEQLQLLAYGKALDVMAAESEWLRGAFLWKWFVGGSRRADFRLDKPAVRDLLRSRWFAEPVNSEDSRDSAESAERSGE